MGWQRWGAWLQEQWWRWQRVPSSPEKITWPLDSTWLAKTTLYVPSKYPWYPSKTWIDPIRDGCKRFLDVHLDSELNIEPGFHLVVLELEWEQKRYPIVVDYFDKTDICEEWAQRCFLYFKMQHHPDGYGLKHVLPGGFVVREDRIYDYLHRLRELRRSHPPKFDVYGRFGASFAQEIRQRALQLLQEQERFAFEGSMKLIRYSHYLQETALAKICIDLPGNGDFCFRLVDSFAIGSCVIGPRHRNRLHVPLLDRVHLAYTQDDLSDLIELCAYYLEHEDQRQALCEQSLDFFERYLHREQLAAYYLHSFYRHLAALQKLREHVPSPNLPEPSK